MSSSIPVLQAPSWRSSDLQWPLQLPPRSTCLPLGTHLAEPQGCFSLSWAPNGSIHLSRGNAEKIIVCGAYWRNQNFDLPLKLALSSPPVPRDPSHFPNHTLLVPSLPCRPTAAAASQFQLAPPSTPEPLFSCPGVCSSESCQVWMTSSISADLFPPQGLLRTPCFPQPCLFFPRSVC